MCFGGCLQSVWWERRAQALVKHPPMVCAEGPAWCETCQPQNTSHLLPSPNPTYWSDLFHLANPAISSDWSKKGSSKQLCQEKWGAPSSATAVREMVARSRGLRALEEISSFVAADSTSANKTMAQNKSTSGSQSCHVFWLFLCRRCPGPVCVQTSCRRNRFRTRDSLPWLCKFGLKQKAFALWMTPLFIVRPCTSTLNQLPQT